jgi:serine O-acetyltransferase
MHLPSINELIDTILEKDPAARSRLEVVLCYPGFQAFVIHQIANQLWRNQLFTLGRFVSHIGRVLTGIEIHPGATVGRRVFIDHGMGVVIGETAIIGDDCVIYQGVTLGAGAAARMGALSRGKKRHPTLGQGVIVGSNAEVQGDIELGDNTRIASGSILLKSVPANSVVVGVPGRVIYQDGLRVGEDVTADIEAEAIKSLKQSIEILEDQFDQLQQQIKDPEKFQFKEQSSLSSSPDAQPSTQRTRVNTDPVDVFLNGAGI